MLKAQRQRVILKRANQQWPLSEDTNDRDTKWMVVDGEWYTPGDIVYYVPHTALIIYDEDGVEHMAVPTDQIVAVLLPNPTDVPWAK